MFAFNVPEVRPDRVCLCVSLCVSVCLAQVAVVRMPLVTFCGANATLPV